MRTAEREDTGVYYCKGVNGFGSAETRIDLIVIGGLQTINQSINKSVNQLINQLINQSINQSINLVINALNM